MSEVSDLANRFWDLGNYAIAFFTAQILAFVTVTYAGPEKARDRLLNERKLVILATIISDAIVFLPSIWLCFLLERRLRLSAHQPEIMLASSLAAVWGRTLWLLLFSGLLILRMWHHRK